jgi:hypothetical protein
MSGRDIDETPRPYASPACSLHEIDPAYAGLTLPPASKTAEKTGSQSSPGGSRPSPARPRPARAKKLK